MNKTFTVHQSNVSIVEKNIADLNKKFMKFGIPTIKHTYSELNEFECYDMDVAYEDVPSISGEKYKYLGLISDEDGTKLYNGFEENEQFSAIRKMECKCDLCKKNISTRTSFFVFEKEDTKEIKMFGSSCAKSIFPFDIGKYFIGLDHLFEDIESLCDEDGYFEGGRIVGGKKAYSTDTLIRILANVTNDFTCWTSKDKADMTRTMSTKEQVFDELFKKKGTPHD